MPTVAATDKKAPKTMAKKPAAKVLDKAVASMLDAHPDLKNTVAQIEKQFGEGAIMPLGVGTAAPIDGIPTGSLSLDIALGGQGIPCGRVVEIFGPESSGKTTLALHVVAQAQKRRRHRRLHRRRARPGPLLGQEARRRARNAAGQPARAAAKRPCTSPKCSSSRTPST